jgi:uncharacterized protein YbjT (DUF2867 family)
MASATPGRYGARVLLVAGATGDLGRRIVRRLREREQPVRALVRPTTDATTLSELGVEIAAGDLVDQDSLSAACAGVQTVICTATAIARSLSGSGGPSLGQVDDVGVGNLVRAAEQASVQRFVYLSYAGVDAGLGFPLERAKAANEERLRRAAVREVIVRPDGYQDLQLTPTARFDIAGGKVAVFGKGDTRRRFVSTEDVAALVVALALEPDPPALVEVGGPDALSRNEAIETVESLTGSKVKRQRMPRPLVRLGMRALARPKPALASVFGIGLLMDLHESRADDSPLRERSIHPRSTRDYLREQTMGLAERVS